jgi:hypothetical protein
MKTGCERRGIQEGAFLKKSPSAGAAQKFFWLLFFQKK